MRRLWQRITSKRTATLSEREAREAVRVGRRLTMIREVYPRGGAPSSDRD